MGERKVYYEVAGARMYALADDDGAYIIGSLDVRDFTSSGGRIRLVPADGGLAAYNKNGCYIGEVGLADGRLYMNPPDGSEFDPPPIFVEAWTPLLKAIEADMAQAAAR